MEQIQNDIEREALVSLYRATGGDKWCKNTGWCSNKRVSTWFGVKVKNGHIVELDLHGNCLEGSLPPEIGNLEWLELLRLSDNDLCGPIPEELFRLVRLKYLFLGRNSFDGEINTGIGLLTELESLHLEMNNLSGKIPVEISHLPNLKVLDLSWNKLEGEIPSQVGQLSKLTSLNLERNCFTGTIPPFLGELHDLKNLNLCLNDFSGEIPDNISHLEKLVFLDISCNDLEGKIPSKLMLWESTRIFFSWGNNLQIEQETSGNQIDLELFNKEIELRQPTIPKWWKKHRDDYSIVYRYNSSTNYRVRTILSEFDCSFGEIAKKSLGKYYYLGRSLDDFSQGLIITLFEKLSYKAAESFQELFKSRNVEVDIRS